MFCFTPMTPADLLRRAVFIVGPTSVGKSALALDWARRHEGEIVCADAFQLYREFPVLAAQPPEAAGGSVPHHLYGAVSCVDNFDAARYAEKAHGVLADIVARGRTPFVVGGSGLYLQALLRGLPALPAIAPALREEVRALTLEVMVSRLRELDPESLAVLDAKNPRRVARRLELCLQTGHPASRLLTAIPPAPDGLRGVLLTRPREELSARIADAVAWRLEHGAMEEVRATRSIAGETARQILGWREITALLNGKLGLADCRERLIIATRQYAKRQLTWFRGKSTFPEANLSDVTPEILEDTALRPSRA